MRFLVGAMAAIVAAAIVAVDAAPAVSASSKAEPVTFTTYLDVIPFDCDLCVLQASGAISGLFVGPQVTREDGSTFYSLEIQWAPKSSKPCPAYCAQQDVKATLTVEALDGSGTITFELAGTETNCCEERGAYSEVVGKWRISDATGAYVGLKGKGTFDYLDNYYGNPTWTLTGYVLL